MPYRVRWFAVLVLVVRVTLWMPGPAAADNEAEPLSSAQLAAVFPGAERVGRFEGAPPAAEVYTNGSIVGYLVSTYATVGSTGYSGKPLDVLVGINRDSTITGALLVGHTEPIFVIGITDEQLARYVGGFAGVDLRQRLDATTKVHLPDAISGATVSSEVIRDAIIRAGRAVARSRGLLGDATSRDRLDRERIGVADWKTLIADGSIAHAHFEDGDDGTRSVDLDLYATLLTPPRIGENLLGKLTYTRLVGALAPDDQIILIAANGRPSIKGTAFVRSGRFDRLQIVQGERTFPLTADGYVNIETLNADGAPELREIGVFTLPGSSGFDPLKPWRVDVRALPSAANPTAAALSLDYVLPDRYRIRPVVDVPTDAAADQPLWQRSWAARSGRIVGVSLMLGVLTVILVFQTPVVQRPRLYRRLRLSFLAVTLIWLGWYANGQLSVVNVLTFSHALMSGFNWQFFLVEPVIFILWSYVAVALLFLGRGVYCGWLCPFGALQELTNEIARRLRVPQLSVPFGLHERLWPIKYVIFIGLFAVSLNSMTDAFIGAEVEPFKTAISLHFVRQWPFVAYALTLLVIGLFINRFFCRYLCPLGAALAIPARLRMFEWLRRRPQCGRECQVCFPRCPVQAIHPDGPINPNECIYCLKCQTIYLDDSVCPPLAARRKRRERREALSAGKSVAFEER